MILFGSYFEIHAGCSVRARTGEEDGWGVAVLQSLPKEGKFLLLQMQTDAYRRPRDLETRWAPPSLWTHSFSDAIITTTRRKDLKINVHRRMKGRKKYQSGIIITVYKTFHSFIIINCKVLLMHILSQHSCHMWSEDSEPVPGDNGTDIDNQEFLLCSSQHSHSSDWN